MDKLKELFGEGSLTYAELEAKLKDNKDVKLANLNIQEVARRLGHSNIEMTWNVYSHLYPKEEERALEILNQIRI